MSELVFEIDNSALFDRVCGVNDVNLKYIEKYSRCTLIPRGRSVILKGDHDKIENVNRLLHILSDYLHDKDSDFEFDQFDIRYMLEQAQSGKKINISDLKKMKIIIPESRKSVFPKSMMQAHYISEISKRPVTFGIGPAGTGKTYLAVACALNEFFNERVSRIILTRPAVEAGESLGYLPGDFIQKINPYLRPLYDALFDLVSFEKITQLIENNLIEIAPLAYMRGRTLNNAFIILDEAQNTTLSQMKMFLTRLGNNSKMVISGDQTQIDIDKPSKSGLIQSMKLLKNIDEVSFVKFSGKDICRHPIVEKIVSAYEKNGNHNQ